MKKVAVLFLLISFLAEGQTIDSLYRQANSFREKYATKFYYGISEIKAVDKTPEFWYLTQTPKGSELFIIHAETKEQTQAVDKERLESDLTERYGNKASRN